MPYIITILKQAMVTGRYQGTKPPQEAASSAASAAQAGLFHEGIGTEHQGF